ncbi:MAG TPA: CAP domain-containing protein [Candidatus Dormibacteraeota bacterium]|nr:CAP domain-containing protein [Candidatus Dormibacteraeota bacterium]
MRLTSSFAACLAAFAVVAITVMALHGGGNSARFASSSVFLVPSTGHEHVGTVGLTSTSIGDATSGTKTKIQPPAPRFSAPVSRTPARIVIGSYQQSLINRDRASAGLGPLTWSSCLSSVAVANAVRLSRQGWVQPYHTNGPSLDLGCHLGNQAGENVGYWSGGINDVQLNTMFMNSPEHRANIMGPYHYVGTAWAVGANGAAYIAVEFG